MGRPASSGTMPQIFARAVFLLTAAFFAAFFLWPVLQILQGGFLDTNGHLTFAYLALVLADPLCPPVDPLPPPVPTPGFDWPGTR